MNQCDNPTFVQASSMCSWAKSMTGKSKVSTIGSGCTKWKNRVSSTTRYCLGASHLVGGSDTAAATSLLLLMVLWHCCRHPRRRVGPSGRPSVRPSQMNLNGEITPYWTKLF